jgi:hypothetical protein
LFAYDGSALYDVPSGGRGRILEGFEPNHRIHDFAPRRIGLLPAGSGV